jgi:hypothetical protein
VHVSGITSVPFRVPTRLALAALLSFLIILMAIAPVIARLEPVRVAGNVMSAADAVGHLVISELVTGAASASDEFAEIYNPSADALPLEGLELIYVSASGTTVTRKAAWVAGAPSVPPGAHWLVANSAGLYGPMADTTYANGLAATGGSVALRIQGATAAIDALGWGTATSTWLEGTPAPAPPAGSSLERLPGGSAGSGQDTNDNIGDFVTRTAPDPQNAAAAPIASPSPSISAIPSGSPSPSATPSELPSPSLTPAPTDSPTPSATLSASPSETPSHSATPTPSATPSPSPTPSVTPSPTPLPEQPIPIADARLLPDDSVASISGVALTGSDFTDGGGCLADQTAGIAVLLSLGAFARGDRVLVTGSVGDRYAQRTMRSSAADIAVVGAGADPTPIAIATGGIGEVTECELVELSASIVSAPISLTSGIAFDVDDGSGSVRVLVPPGTGIDTAEWVRGAHVALIGVAGQRDSSGTDIAGYRVMPRDADDILELAPPATPSPSPSASPSPSPSATTTPQPGSPTPTPNASPRPTGSPSATPSPSASIPPVIEIRQARALATGAVVHVRGIVTLGSGVVDGTTAVIQDASGAIALRLGDKAGRVRRGLLLDVVGVRSTKAGMLTIRVDQPPRVVGSSAEPTALVVATGGAGEQLEARLLLARGTVTSTPVRSTAGNVAFTIDDGSGPLRVTLFSASGISRTGLVRGAFTEVRGVLGQQTTGQQPERGYRLWPRDSADLKVYAATAAAASGGESTVARSGASDGSGSGVAGDARMPRLGDAVVGSSSSTGKAGALSGDSSAEAGRAIGLGASGARSGEESPDTGAGANPPTGELASGALERLAARSLGSRYASALLLTALALSVLLGVLAWRTGAFGRLRLLVQRVAGDELLPASAPASPSVSWGTTPTEGGEHVT